MYVLGAYMRNIDRPVKAKIHDNHRKYLVRAQQGEQLLDIRSRYSSSFGCRNIRGLTVPIVPHRT